MSEPNPLDVLRLADLAEAVDWLNSNQHEAGRQMIEAIATLDASAPIEPEMREMLLRLARIGLADAMRERDE